MNIKNNQRTQNTQNKIKEVLIELLAEKPINKITIQDICRKADVNRTTFYTHFNDIYDLMRKIEVEKMHAIHALFHTPEGEDCPSFEGFPSFNEVTLERLINFILENPNFYKIYLNDFNVCQTFMATAHEQEYEQEHEHIRKSLLCKENPISETALWYQFEYIKAGLMGVIRTWLNTDCKESPKELAIILKHCLPEAI